MAEPGTWRTDNNEPVAWPEAIDAWVPAARDVLIDTARNYGAYLRYADLAEAVQARAGIRTRVLLPNWIGQVLGDVADAQPVDEPMLSSLVVHAEGTIGDGYAAPVLEREGTVPDDLDLHAAAERLACYRYFGAELPPNGGRPQLTVEVAQARRNRPVQKPADVCPTCNLAMPVTGVCDTCG